VSPLLKKDGFCPDELKNYRPVANLPFISKVLERVVVAQLTTYLSANRLQDPLQSAYREGHSTETAVLKIKSDIDTILDEGDAVLLVLLNLNAAFNTKDYELLLSRLEQLSAHTRPFQSPFQKAYVVHLQLQTHRNPAAGLSVPHCHIHSL
jgi:hypothetical protein